MTKNKEIESTIKTNELPIIIQELCSEEWLPLIEFHQKKIFFPKGAYIFKEGEEVKGIKIIDYGKVKVFTSLNIDSEKIIRLAGDGVFLGHRGFGTEKTYPVSAIALSDTLVTFLPNNIFTTILKANSKLSFFFLNFFADELRNSEIEAKNHVRYSAKQRIVSSILNTIQAFGYDNEHKNQLAYTLTRQDIANHASTTYETVIRTLGELDKQKTILLDGKQIRILNLEELRSILSE